MVTYSHLGILIADKEESPRHQIGAHLSKKYWVWTFDTGNKALEKLRKTQVDILISGLDLMDMKGLDLIKKARKIYPQIYVIMAISASKLEKKMEQLRETVSDFITKPVDEKQLNLVLRRAVDHQQLLRKKEFYKELSILDHLTKVYNRRYLDLMLARELERAKRFSHSFSLLMMDIDNFKKYNEKNGHLAGDSLLQRFASLLMRSSRIPDSVFRYGGDEFLVLLPETSKKDAVTLARRIEAVLKEEKFKGIEAFSNNRLTTSIGLASYPEDGVSADALLSLADQMMFNAKRRKVNKVCFAGKI